MNIKHITYIYLTLLLLGTLLPINGFNYALNNNYALTIRWDYLLHAMVYWPLPFLLKKIIKKFYWIMLVSLMIAAALESLQHLLPYRAFNTNDLLANGIGVLLGLGLVAVMRKGKKSGKPISGKTIPSDF